MRDVLRTSWGVSKHSLAQYVGMFQWGDNIKVVTDEFLRILPGVSPFTKLAS